MTFGGGSSYPICAINCRSDQIEDLMHCRCIDRNSGLA